MEIYDVAQGLHLDFIVREALRKSQTYVKETYLNPFVLWFAIIRCNNERYIISLMMLIHDS